MGVNFSSFCFWLSRWITCNFLRFVSCYHWYARYVDIGETPVTAGIREIEEQTQIILPSNISSAFNLIGVYNDPTKDISEELRSTITVSYATEYDPSKTVTTDGTGIPKPSNRWRELVTLPLEEIGTTYTNIHFEENNFSYIVLTDLKRQFQITSSARQLSQESNINRSRSHSTCM